MRTRVAWLAPYPVPPLAPAIKLTRDRPPFHPAGWLVNLSKALAATGEVDLHILTESTLVAADQVTQQDGITFHVIKSSMPIINRGYPPFFPVDLLTGFAPAVHGLLRTVRKLQPDLVHAHGTEAAYAPAAVKSGLPCVISIQGIISEYFKTNPSFRFRVVRHYEQTAVRKARYFTCRTDFDTGFIRSLNPQARIFTIHEAMSPAFFENDWKPASSDTILFVGSLEPRKGLPVLLDALALVKQHRPGVHLNIVGRGSLESDPSLKQQCERLQVIPNLQFHGFQPAAEMARLHLQSQVFVLPSQNENSPNSLAEAMVSGMPVIATRVGGVPSLVADGETGLLVPWGDSKVLAERIEWLLAHPEERARLGQRARQIARARHLPEKVAEETLAAYKEILSEAANR